MTFNLNKKVRNNLAFFSNLFFKNHDNKFQVSFYRKVRLIVLMVEVRRIELLSRKCLTFKDLQFISFAYNRFLRNEQTSPDLLTGIFEWNALSNLFTLSIVFVTA